MQNPLFNVILDGTIKPGQNLESTRNGLARLMKIDMRQAESLLAGKSVVVKREVTEDLAQRYKNAIEQTGACCSVLPIEKEPQTALRNTDDKQKPTSAAAHHADAAAKPPPIPPQVGNSAQPPPIPPREKAGNAAFASVQTATDSITDKLGLEKIEGFSLSALFSEVFRKHDPDEVECLLTVGTKITTPKLNASMGIMPNPWIFFRVLSGTVIAYLIFLFAWNKFHNINLIPGLIIIGSFAIPFSVLVLFFELNTPRNISIIKVVQLVVIGGAISLLVSLALFEITPLLGIFGASAAGVVEEAGKLAALLIALKNMPQERYTYRLNALLLGAAVGTGFAAFESAGYALRAGLHDNSEMLALILLRGVMSPFAHIVWTAIAASAFWIAKGEEKDITKIVTSSRFLRIFLIPVVLHFIWNMPFEGPFMAKYVIIGFVAWVVVISLIQSGLKEISEKCQRKNSLTQ